VLHLLPLNTIHHNRHRRQHTNPRKHPRNNLNDLQFMALGESILEPAFEGANALVADDGAPHLVDENTRDDPEDGGEDKEDRMKHTMEILPRKMKPAINRTQHNRPHTTENQKRQPRTLRLPAFLRAPGVCLLFVLETVNGEDKLGDGEGEHYAEEDWDIPGGSAIAAGLRACLSL